MKRRVLLMTPLLLTACASVAPPPRVLLPMLRLPPAALGRTLSLVQRLSVSRLDAPEAAAQGVDVLLEADAQGLRLAGFAFNQRVLTLAWDGQDVAVQRHAMLPAEVDTDRMLRDLSLVFWPAGAVRAALPPGWSLSEEASSRSLRWQGEALLTIAYTGGIALVELINQAEGYALRIESKVQS